MIENRVDAILLPLMILGLRMLTAFPAKRSHHRQAKVEEARCANGGGTRDLQGSKERQSLKIQWLQSRPRRWGTFFNHRPWGNLCHPL